MITKNVKNKSVLNIHRIAKEYGYKEEVVRTPGGLAFLSINNPFNVTPYSRHIISEIATYKYVKKIFDQE